MKKLAIGCGILALVAIVVVVGAASYGAYKLRGTVVQFAELSRIPDMEREVRVQSRFTAPASGELTAAQVERLMAVQKRVHDRLGQNVDAFQRTYKSLADKKQATALDVPALLSAYRDLAAMWIDAKRTQIAALNDAGLSLDEYRWIKSRAYQAIGAPFMDVDFGRIAEAVKAGQEPQAPASLEGAFMGKPPVANVTLVEPLKKQLQDNLGLASFGL